VVGHDFLDEDLYIVFLSITTAQYLVAKLLVLRFTTGNRKEPTSFHTLLNKGSDITAIST
jgi:hypothetical protein